MSKRVEGVTAFRLSAVVAVVVPFLLALVARDVAVATVVGLAFAMAAATFCPLLVLGIWWRGLTDVGALAGLLVGGALTGGAVVDNLLTDRDGRLVRRPGRPAGGLGGAARLRHDGGRLPAHPAPAAAAHLAVHGPAAHPGDGRSSTAADARRRPFVVRLRPLGDPRRPPAEPSARGGGGRATRAATVTRDHNLHSRRVHPWPNRPPTAGPETSHDTKRPGTTPSTTGSTRPPSSRSCAAATASSSSRPPSPSWPGTCSTW